MSPPRDPLQRMSTFALSIAALIVFGAWLRRDALSAGFWADDYLHFAMLHGLYPLAREPWDLFRFADGSAADTRVLIDLGYYPWWTHERFQLSMLRPLPSLLHALDYARFGLDATKHHLHSFLWWALSVSTAASVFSVALPRGVALLATALFALDESHSVPLVWLSNRSVLVTTALGFAGLALHAQHRRAPHALKRAGSLLLLALALASGEYALGVVGYLVAFELVQPDPASTRLRAALPVLVACAAYLVALPALGYGSAHSGLYTSPFDAPLAYAQKLGAGLPVLAGELLFGLRADYYTFGAPWQLAAWPTLQIALGATALGCGAALVAWLRRVLPAEQARSVTWLSLGALFALAPVLSSFIATRLALPAALGASGLLASVIVTAASQLRSGPRERSAVSAALAAAVVVVHGPLAAVASARSTHSMSDLARSRTLWALSAQLDETRTPTQSVVLVASADANDAAFFPFLRPLYARAMPRHLRVLSGVPAPHTLARLDAHTVDLGVEDLDAVAGSVMGSLTRGLQESVEVGQRFRLDGLTAEVLAVHQGQPVRTRFRFDAALDSPELVWLQSTDKGLRPLELPAPGKKVRLPAPQPPDLALLASPAGR